MFANNYWAHFGPNGESPWQYITAAGYSYSMAGENLAQGFSYSKDVVDKWMASPTHRDNILKPEYQDVGYAIVNGQLQGEDTTLVVQLFGRKITAESNPNNLVAGAREPKPTIILVTPTTIITQSPVAQTEPKSNIKTNLAAINTALPSTSPQLNITLVIFGLLFIALIIDLIFAYRLHLFRVTGKNMAHLFFIAIIIASIFMLRQGRIL